MPRQSLASLPKRFLILVLLGLVVVWGVSPGGRGWAAPVDAHLSTEGLHSFARAKDLTPSDMATGDLQIQPLPDLAQAPAIPDLEPEADSTAWEDDGDVRGFVWALLRLLLLLLFPPVIAGLGFWWVKHWLGQQRPKCETCGVLTTLLTQAQAKPYLDAGQQVEVDLSSVFHSVAICPQCARRKAFRFAIRNRLVLPCPRCEYRTLAITQQTTTTRPTRDRPGEAIVQRTCRYCGHTATSTEVLSPNPKGHSEGVAAFGDREV